MSHKKNLRTCLLALVLLSALTYAQYNENELIEILKAKDLQFDNALLEYTTRSKIRMGAFPTWKYPGFAERHKWPKESLKAIEIDTIYHEKLIVRSSESTFIRELDKSLFPEKLSIGMVVPTPYTKWSNIEGIQREISNNYPNDHDKRDMILEIANAGRSGDISQEQRMEIEFAFGMGIGKRIKKITSIESGADGFTLVKGDIQVYTRDESTFQIKLDDDLIVRQGRIEALVDNMVMNILEFETKGTVLKNELLFPKEGGFKHTRYALVDGEKMGKERCTKDISVEFKDLRLGLSDEEYSQFTDMSVPDGTFVIDKIAGVNYIKGKGVRLPDEIFLNKDLLSQPVNNFNKKFASKVEANLEKEASETKKSQNSEIVSPDASAVIDAVPKAGTKKGKVVSHSQIIISIILIICILAYAYFRVISRKEVSK